MIMAYFSRLVAWGGEPGGDWAPPDLMPYPPAEPIMGYTIFILLLVGVPFIGLAVIEWLKTKRLSEARERREIRVYCYGCKTDLGSEGGMKCSLCGHSYCHDCTNGNSDGKPSCCYCVPEEKISREIEIGEALDKEDEEIVRRLSKHEGEEPKIDIEQSKVVDLLTSK